MEPRRQLSLPSGDVEYLDSTQLVWETIVDGRLNWLLVHDRPVPPGYTVSRAIAALQIPPSYPDAQIDMVYFFPGLVRTDGKSIGAVRNHPQPIDGKTFQRWSRHRTREAPWRSGLDDVSTHFALVDDWMEREFRKG